MKMITIISYEEVEEGEAVAFPCYVTLFLESTSNYLFFSFCLF